MTAPFEVARDQDLPLNGRNFMELATLTTGINEGNSSSQKSLGRGFGPAAAGQPATENSYNLDGGNNQEGFTNVFSVVPSVDAVQEFNIQVGQYSAEYGGGGGAVIDVVTRAGPLDDLEIAGDDRALGDRGLRPEAEPGGGRALVDRPALGELEVERVLDQRQVEGAGVLERAAQQPEIADGKLRAFIMQHLNGHERCLTLRIC